MKTLQLFVIVCLTLFSISNLSAQESSALSNQQRINIGPLSYSYELPVGDMQTIQFEGGLSYSFSASATFGTGGSSSEFLYAVAPFVEVTYRGYTKLKTETKKGKPLQDNSGNYFFGQIAGIYGPIATNINDFEPAPAFTLGGGWGFQRVYKNNFVLNFGLGLGYIGTTRDVLLPVTFIGDGGIGFLIGR